mgnify:CR=1 FL=1
MEELFIKILQLITEEMPELSLVDEDYGQLETEEDTYPVTFPCVLIGNVEADWNDIGMGTQKGVVKMSARLAIDCYDDTHYGSGTEDKVASVCKWQTNYTPYSSASDLSATWGRCTEPRRGSMLCQGGLRCMNISLSLR